MPLKALLKSLPRAAPRFIEPMKARLTARLPDEKEWMYEIKFDGVRALGIKDGKRVALISRNRKDLAGKYPGVVKAIGKLDCNQIVLDGEVVAVDEKGRPSFQLLQRANQSTFNKPDLFYYAFDILNVDGRDTTGLPLLKRKALLKILIQGKSDCIRFSDVLPGEGEEIAATLQKWGLEGLIAKQRNSRYEAGLRTGAWVKFKWTSEQEFVIGGYTRPEGTRKYFGAILVGIYDKGKLIFVSKVGTGFDEKSLKMLHAKFQTISRESCPFTDWPEVCGSPRSRFTRAEARACQWVEPKLVGQVRFTEWTDDGRLRHPVFLGLREDKDATEVVRETAADAGKE